MFRAGITRVTVQDTVPFDTLIAYPTEAAEVPFQAGPFTVAASHDAPIASGINFPVVLFSHGVVPFPDGNGRSGGTSLLHRDLIASLARQGFVVVAPFHPVTSHSIKDRLRQIHKALDTTLADPRFAAHVDQKRVGMIGFSFGGTVALIAGGAIPNLTHLLSAYCRNRAGDPRACGGAPADGRPPRTSPETSEDGLALRALVLLEPWGEPFDRDGLRSVQMPVLLYRAQDSDLAAAGNIFALAAGLPRPPQQETTPGGHFIFVDPCPPAMEADAPAACKDAVGVDRVAVHRRIESEIAAFLRQNL